MHSQPIRKWLLPSAIAAALLAILFGAVFLQRLLADPNIFLLTSEGGAQWIRYPEPTLLIARELGDFQTSFRVEVQIDAPPEEAVLTLRALRLARVSLDGKILLEKSGDLDQWKTPLAVDIAPALKPGKHELRVDVFNHNGARALLAYCGALGLVTGEHWEVAEDGETWRPALPVDEYLPTELSQEFYRPHEVLIAKLPLFLPLFLMVFLWSALPRESRPPWLGRVTPRAAYFHWILLAAWLILAANNIFKIPPTAGFDTEGHINYIHFLAREKRLPLATEGWQMFQPPLYYLLSVFPYVIFSKLVELDTVIQLLRFIPLLCGAAQVEICYRAVRHVYPNREDLQIAGTFIGGLLPMNLYMTQYIGNEPTSAFMTSMVVLFSLKLLRGGPESRTARDLALLGLWIGLALLTKITVLLIMPPVVLLIGHAVTQELPWSRAALLKAGRAVAIVAAVTLLVAGWFFLRNQIEMGKPLVRLADNMPWWQDPGYRTPSDFYTFGEVLVRPITATCSGFWNSIYGTFWLDGNLSAAWAMRDAPPWNYGYVIAGAWLALIPASLMILGFFRGLAKPRWAVNNGALFAAACVALFFAAALYMYLVAPVYSVGKATYSLGLTPCYAILAVTGLDLTTHYPKVRSLCLAALACWATAAYAAYFVL